MVSSKNNTKNVFIEKSLNLLYSAALYGANASGKTNLIKAFDFMKSMMIIKQKRVFQSIDTLPYEPFKLSTETEFASSSFEVVFFHKGIKFRYGFEADQHMIYSEWIFADEKGKEAKLFFRDQDEELYVNHSKFKEGKHIKVLHNSLLIWKCDQEGGPISKLILEWFSQINVIYGYSPHLLYTLLQMKDETFKSNMINMVKKIDLGIEDILIEENHSIQTIDFDKDPILKEIKEILEKYGSMQTIEIKTLHKKFNQSNQEFSYQKFDLMKDESEGTKNFFALTAPLIDTLMNGKILVIDELDKSLHPFLTSELIRMFNDPQINSKNAQLIFSTHDTHLLDQSLFHKSQIWFVEKDSLGITQLNSLVEYKNIRENDPIEKYYMHGRFGGVPEIQHLRFEENNDKKTKKSDLRLAKKSSRKQCIMNYMIV